MNIHNGDMVILESIQNKMLLKAKISDKLPKVWFLFLKIMNGTTNLLRDRVYTPIKVYLPSLKKLFKITDCTDEKYEFICNTCIAKDKYMAKGQTYFCEICKQRSHVEEGFECWFVADEMALVGVR